SDDRELWIVGRKAVNCRTARFYMRAESLARFDFAPPLLGAVQIAAHVAHACDSPGEVHRKLALLVPEVDVHVPEAGDEVLAAGLDGFGLGGGANGGRDGLNSIGVYEYGFV